MKSDGTRMKGIRLYDASKEIKLDKVWFIGDPTHQEPGKWTEA